MCHWHCKAASPTTEFCLSYRDTQNQKKNIYKNVCSRTHVDFKVFWCRVDVASGGVVARQVVQSHMTYPDGVRQRDDQGALDAVKRPAFPREQHRVTLERQQASLATPPGKANAYRRSKQDVVPGWRCAGSQTDTREGNQREWCTPSECDTSLNTVCWWCWHLHRHAQKKGPD